MIDSLASVESNWVGAIARRLCLCMAAAVAWAVGMAGCRESLALSRLAVAEGLSMCQGHPPSPLEGISLVVYSLQVP